MADQDEKVRENRLRRWAKRLGLELSKSRAREFKVHDRGGWQLFDNEGNVVGPEHYVLNLAAVEVALEVHEKMLRAEVSGTNESLEVDQ